MGDRKSLVVISRVLLYSIFTLITIFIPLVSCGETLDYSMFEDNPDFPSEEKRAIGAGKASDAIPLRFHKWPGGIVPYKISNHFSLSDQRLIKDAMDEINRYTCITFIPRGNQISYINIIHGPKCSTLIGRIPDRPQDVMLTEKCFNRGRILHELLHTLGFFHEQSRKDRDNYVSIITPNIEPGKQHNFHKLTSNKIEALGVPYDYRSVLHYSMQAFVRPHVQPGATMIPTELKDPHINEARIGHYCHLSRYDCLKIIRMYCPEDENKYRQRLKNLEETNTKPHNRFSKMRC